MFLLIIWLIIGAATGGGMAWIMEDRGGLNKVWSVIVGVIAAEVGGFVFMTFGASIVGNGPEFIASFVAAAVIAAVAVLIVGLIKK
jgi:uncharacterized membrane protein YeaQ/YmgE (transglycosylase-associated protein family)